MTLHLDGAVAEALAVEAARRGQTADQLAADLLAAQLTRVPRRRLAFAAVGASTSGRVRIATLNRRHFAVVRPRHADAFELLP